MNYISHSKNEIKEMLSDIQKNDINELFRQIPDNLKIENLGLEKGLTEPEVLKEIQKIAAKNKNLLNYIGAGAYEHYIPASISHITSRSEFFTAYTPYQPEVSQGTLQAIYEFQTLICNLMGLPVTNASMYDGATALSEAVIMAKNKHPKKNKVLISKLIHPEYKKVLYTYSKNLNIEIEELEINNCLTDSNIEQKLNNNVFAIVIANPNFTGQIENMQYFSDLAHKNKSEFIALVNPMTLGILKSPGHYKADIAVAEGQPFGMPLSFGGPYLGIIAASSKYMRKIPGRIVGKTTDKDGKEGFVLTLQAREQHIRREKATSNICSNQALCALTATIYLSLLGKKGIKEVCLQNINKAHYLYERINNTGNIKKQTGHKFFNEFVITFKNENDFSKVLKAFEKNNIAPGLNLSKYIGDEYKNSLLVCVTETKNIKDLDNYVKILHKTLGGEK